MMKLTQKALPKPLNKKICNEAFTTSAVVKSQPLEHTTYRGFSCFHSLLLTPSLSLSHSSLKRRRKIRIIFTYKYIHVIANDSIKIALIV